MRRRTILDAMTSPAVFGPTFRPAATWRAWRAFLGALFALPLGPEAFGLYAKHTGRESPPVEPFREAWVIAGRRGGKSRIAALVAVFLGAFHDYGRVLAPGERGTVMVIAADRRQARTVFRYVTGLLESVPMLARMIEARRAEAVDLGNRVTIEVHTASFRTIRGYTIIGAVLDEVAFWPSDDSANPDTEILAAIRPGMATVPGSLLLAISSPYARRGALWDAYRRHHGEDGAPVLVWRAETRAMNPTVDERVIADAYAEDEASASAEYGAEFRRDVETFISREAVAAVVVPDRLELPPVDGVEYLAFVDPSGGSRDSMTLAVAHAEGRNGSSVAVLDALRERRPPFSPEDVVGEFAQALRPYRVSTVVGDRYAGEWPRERFRVHGVDYELAEKPKSDIYRDLLPLVNSARAELLDDRRLVAQLVSLERRTARGGRDSISKGPNAHDDVVNAAAGALVLAAADEGEEVRIL